MLKILGITTLLVLSASSQAALRVHLPTQEPPTAEPAPSMDSISGKGQRQALQSVLMQLSRNQLDVRFVEPALKDMQINWSASEEPLEIILSRLGRQYQIDLSLNRSAHTLYVAIDNGQCTPHREQSLSEISRVWRALGIDKRPQLPPSLVIPVDSAGYSQRLC